MNIWTAALAVCLLVFVGCATSPSLPEPGGDPSSFQEVLPTNPSTLVGLWPLTLIGAGVLVFGIVGRKVEWIVMGIGLVLIPTLFTYMLSILAPGLKWLIWSGLAIALVMLLTYVSGRLFGWLSIRKQAKSLEQDAEAAEEEALASTCPDTLQKASEKRAQAEAVKSLLPKPLQKPTLIPTRRSPS